MAIVEDQSNNNDNNNNNEEMIALLSWNSTPKVSTYSPSDLQYMRKSSGNGTGFKYYNSHRDTYEFPKQISLVSKKKLEALQTRSASISPNNNSNKNNNPNNRRLPPHIRLHQHMTGGGPGYSITT